jgi:transcriptional regulator with XRE-family HTH domain
MIRNNTELEKAKKRLREEAKRIRRQQKELEELHLSNEEVKRVLDPLRSFHQQLKEEVAGYERLKHGEFNALNNFEGLERLLVALRIAKGLTQRELAQRLGVHESQVSRDERNEYHGITLERARRILEAMGVEVSTAVVSLNGGSRKVGSRRSSRHGMPRTIRFHLDEHCDKALAVGLRRSAIDVTTPDDAELLQASDQSHIAFARAQARVIFTQDRDFLRIHASGVPHLGIVYCRQASRSIGELIRGLVLLWEVYDPDEMVTRVEFL